jgi:hypothetical protein
MQSAIQFKCYPGGHAMYLDPPARQDLSLDVRRFVHGSGSPR